MIDLLADSNRTTRAIILTLVENMQIQKSLLTTQDLKNKNKIFYFLIIF